MTAVLACIIGNKDRAQRAPLSGNGVEAWRLTVTKTARHGMAVVVKSTFGRRAIDGCRNACAIAQAFAFEGRPTWPSNDCSERTGRRPRPDDAPGRLPDHCLRRRSRRFVGDRYIVTVTHEGARRPQPALETHEVDDVRSCASVDSAITEWLIMSAICEIRDRSAQAGKTGMGRQRRNTPGIEKPVPGRVPDNKRSLRPTMTGVHRIATSGKIIATLAAITTVGHERYFPFAHRFLRSGHRLEALLLGNE